MDQERITRRNEVPDELRSLNLKSQRPQVLPNLPAPNLFNHLLDLKESNPSRRVRREHSDEDRHGFGREVGEVGEERMRVWGEEGVAGILQGAFPAM